MDKKLLLFITIISLTIGGCVSGTQLSSQLSMLDGKTESEVINYLGPPKNVYESNGNKFLTFSSSRSVTYSMPATYQTTIIGDTAYTNQTGGGIQNINCSWAVTFTFRNGISIGSRWHDTTNCGASNLSSRLPEVNEEELRCGPCRYTKSDVLLRYCKKWCN